ncbi:hypothetical protein ACFL2O_07245 [Thermodesulfobacteriota bacterium]
MGTIKTTKDMSLNLTINLAEGIILYDDMSTWITEYYSGTVTNLILWDFREADLSKIKTEEFAELARLIKRKADLRQGGKTALVFKRDLEFGLGRMFEVFSELEDLSFEFMSFRSIEEAREWLGV